MGKEQSWARGPNWPKRLSTAQNVPPSSNLRGVTQKGWSGQLDLGSGRGLWHRSVLKSIKRTVSVGHWVAFPWTSKRLLENCKDGQDNGCWPIVCIIWRIFHHPVTPLSNYSHHESSVATLPVTASRYCPGKQLADTLGCPPLPGWQCPACTLQQSTDLCNSILREPHWSGQEIISAQRGKTK